MLTSLVLLVFTVFTSKLLCVSFMQIIYYIGYGQVCLLLKSQTVFRSMSRLKTRLDLMLAIWSEIGLKT